MVALPYEVSAQLVPLQTLSQWFATTYIWDSIISARLLTSPNLHAKYPVPSARLSTPQLLPLQCGYFSGLLVRLADEARLSSCRRVLGAPPRLFVAPQFPLEASWQALSLQHPPPSMEITLLHQILPLQSRKTLQWRSTTKAWNKMQATQFLPPPQLFHSEPPP